MALSSVPYEIWWKNIISKLVPQESQMEYSQIFLDIFPRDHVLALKHIYKCHYFTIVIDQVGIINDIN